MLSGPAYQAGGADWVGCRLSEIFCGQPMHCGSVASVDSVARPVSGWAGWAVGRPCHVLVQCRIRAGVERVQEGQVNTVRARRVATADYDYLITVTMSACVHEHGKAAMHHLQARYGRSTILKHDVQNSQALSSRAMQGTTRHYSVPRLDTRHHLHSTSSPAAASSIPPSSNQTSQ